MAFFSLNSAFRGDSGTGGELKTSKKKKKGGGSAGNKVRQYFPALLMTSPANFQYQDIADS